MRIRTIKPEFFFHEGLAELDMAHRIAFVGLWCAADREGRFEWRPARLKAQIFPYDEVDFSRVLDALTTRGFVVRYAWGTRHYGSIPSFSRHQVINNREKASELPAPSEASIKAASDACPTRAPRVSEMHVHAQAEGKGRERNMEGKGKEGDLVPIGTCTSDEAPKPDPIKVPLQKIVDMYHETCPMLPKVKILTDSRKQAIRNRYRQFHDHSQGPLWAFEVIFHKTADSEFLSGRSGKWGGCNFDWLMKQANFVKVAEGNYDNDNHNAKNANR